MPCGAPLSPRPHSREASNILMVLKNARFKKAEFRLEAVNALWGPSLTPTTFQGSLKYSEGFEKCLVWTYLGAEKILVV